MPDLRDIFLDYGEQPTGFKGRIADDATGPNDEVGVIVPSYDERRPFGPVRFTPRPSWLGGQPLLPSRGDPCTVGFDEDGDIFIIEWWVKDPNG